MEVFVPLLGRIIPFSKWMVEEGKQQFMSSLTLQDEVPNHGSLTSHETPDPPNSSQVSNTTRDVKFLNPSCGCLRTPLF